MATSYDPSDLTIQPFNQSDGFNLQDFTDRYTIIQNHINGIKTNINTEPSPRIYYGTCYNISAPNSYYYVNLDRLSTFKQEVGTILIIKFEVSSVPTYNETYLYLNNSGLTPMPVMPYWNIDDFEYNGEPKNWRFFPSGSFQKGETIKFVFDGSYWVVDKSNMPCMNLRKLYDGSSIQNTLDTDYFAISAFDNNMWYRKPMSNLYDYVHNKLIKTYTYTTTTPPKDDYAVTDIPSTHRGWYFICIRGVYNNSSTFMSSTVLYNYKRYGYMLNPIIRYTNGSIYTQYIECLFQTGTLKLKYWSPYDEKISASNFEIAVVPF